METANGNSEWKRRMEKASGNGEWKRRVETASGDVALSIRRFHSLLPLAVSIRRFHSPFSLLGEKKGSPKAPLSIVRDESQRRHAMAVWPRGARCTLPAFMQRVQTFTFSILPSTTVRITW